MKKFFVHGSFLLLFLLGVSGIIYWRLSSEQRHQLKQKLSTILGQNKSNQNFSSKPNDIDTRIFLTSHKKRPLREEKASKDLEAQEGFVSVLRYDRSWDEPPEVWLDQEVFELLGRKPHQQKNSEDPEQIEEDPPLSLPSENDAANLPHALRADFLKVLELIQKGDQGLRDWRKTSDDDKKNQILKAAQEYYGQARDLLRTMNEREPESILLENLMNQALQGFFSCAKYRTR